MNTINNFQLVSLYVSAILGVGVLSLPRRASEGAGVDGILSVILAGIIFTVITYLYTKLSLKYKNKTIFEYGEILIGKYIIRLAALIFSGYFITIVFLQVRTIGSSVKQYLLFETPVEIVILSIILLSAVAVSLGIVVISRLTSNYYIATILGLIFVLILSLNYFHIETLYPLFSNSLGKISKTAVDLTFDYTGIEIILFAAPFLAKPKDAVKMSSFAMLIVVAIYTVTTAICFGEFNINPNQYIIQPTVILSKAVVLTGAGERVDLLFMSIWVLEAFASMTIMFFMASYCISMIVPQKNYLAFTFLIAPVIYILSLIPQNMGEVNKVADIVKYLAWFGVIPFVFIMYIISLFKRKVA